MAGRRRRGPRRYRRRRRRRICEKGDLQRRRTRRLGPWGAAVAGGAGVLGRGPRVSYRGGEREEGGRRRGKRETEGGRSFGNKKFFQSKKKGSVQWWEQEPGKRGPTAEAGGVSGLARPLRPGLSQILCCSPSVRFGRFLFVKFRPNRFVPVCIEWIQPQVMVWSCSPIGATVTKTVFNLEPPIARGVV
jgi:hypothetical protein